MMLCGGDRQMDGQADEDWAFTGLACLVRRDIGYLLPAAFGCLFLVVSIFIVGDAITGQADTEIAPDLLASVYVWIVVNVWAFTWISARPDGHKWSFWCTCRPSESFENRFLFPLVQYLAYIGAIGFVSAIVCGEYYALHGPMRGLADLPLVVVSVASLCTAVHFIGRRLGHVVCGIASACLLLSVIIVRHCLSSHGLLAFDWMDRLLMLVVVVVCAVAALSSGFFAGETSAETGGHPR